MDYNEIILVDVVRQIRHPKSFLG